VADNQHLSGIVIPNGEAIQRGPLREQVRSQLRQLILSNYLRPSQPIVIDQLARDLGVSHTPVREALAMLQHDGLVRTRPYGNPWVAEIEPLDVREAYEARSVLEGWAVRRAALTLSDAALAEMGAALECARKKVAQSDGSPSSYEAHLHVDIELHSLILDSVDNRLFERLVQLVSNQSIRIRSLVEALAPVEQVLAIIDEHDAILQALRARDPDRSQERLLAHLDAGMERTLKTIESLRVSGQ
jgi:DNA-binding GntR family transcriptional regulator